MRRVSEDKSKKHTRISLPRNEQSVVERYINIRKARSMSSEKSSTHLGDLDKRLEKDYSADSLADNSEQMQKSQEKHTVNSRGCTEESEQHVELTHSKTTEGNGYASHKCGECGKVLSTSYNLLIHRNIHAGIRPYICPVCDKSFRSASGLNRHVRDVHDGVKNFACDV